MKKFLISSLFSILFFPFLTFGQSLSGTDQSVSFKINPNFPRPRESATISVTSFIDNLDKSEIKWYVNNVLIKSGIGEKSFTFQMGDLGENKIIKTIINKGGGGTLTKVFNLNPTEVNLIYEVDTYTPPFYQGKAWFTKQSVVKVVALPRMLDSAKKLISPKNYVYTWKVDGDVIQDKSGFGKNIFTYQSPLISRDIVISVEVSPQYSNNTASANIALPYQNPLLLAYEKNPIYGTIFEHAIFGDYYLNRDEVTFEVVPYFFSANNSFSNLNFEWKMNEKVFETSNQKNEATFRIENNQKGRSNISIKTNNIAKMLQLDELDFSLFFDREKTDQSFNF